MPKYRSKPVVVEAVKWDGQSDTANKFIGGRYYKDWCNATDNAIVISTPRGNQLCKLGDMIIKGIKGECYPCEPDIFEATYKLIDD